MIKIEIANICVGLKLDDAETAQRILDRYADFLSSDGTPEVTVRAEVRDEVSERIINWSFQNEKLSFQFRCVSGQIDMAIKQGHLLMTPHGRIENFLRLFYAWNCLHHGAILFHSAGMIKDGKAFLFFGPSGSGKTTIARLSLDYTVLSDDLVIIKRENSTYIAYGVPFRGAMPEAPRTNAKAVLHGLFRLKKDTQHFTKRLSHPQAVAELVSCVPFVMEDPIMSQKVMDICAELATSVPVKELHFRRDKGFWRMIDETD